MISFISELYTRTEPKNAGTKPAFITDEVTILSVINSIKAEMQNIGNSFSKDEIDSRDMKEQALLTSLGPENLCLVQLSLIYLLH